MARQTTEIADELQEYSRQATLLVERTSGHILRLAKKGKVPKAIAEALDSPARRVRPVIDRKLT